MSKTIGLILGKFAPFHVGHERLLQIALSEVDEVHAIIYDCPDLTNIPLNVRAGWVRTLYPKVNVIEGWDAPNEHEDTPRVKKLQEEYVERVLNGKKITHFFSSEYYGEHMSKSLGAINRRTNRDDPREGYGIYAKMIRATMMRKEEHLNKNYLNVLVYKDLLIKIAILGYPSQSQTELVKLIAEKFSMNCILDDLYQKKQNHTHVDFYKIANERIKKINDEKSIYDAKDFLVFDSAPFVDHLLSVLAHNDYDDSKYQIYSKDMRTYDIVFIIDNEEKNNDWFHNIDPSIFMNQLTTNLDTLGIKYHRINGNIDEKLKKIEKITRALPKRFIKTI